MLIRRSIGKFSNPKDIKNYNPALINQYDSEGDSDDDEDDNDR